MLGGVWVFWHRVSSSHQVIYPLLHRYLGRYNCQWLFFNALAVNSLAVLGIHIPRSVHSPARKTKTKNTHSFVSASSYQSQPERNAHQTGRYHHRPKTPPTNTNPQAVGSTAGYFLGHTRRRAPRREKTTRRAATVPYRTTARHRRRVTTATRRTNGPPTRARSGGGSSGDRSSGDDDGGAVGVGDGRRGRGEARGGLAVAARLAAPPAVDGGAGVEARGAVVAGAGAVPGGRADGGGGVACGGGG